MLELWRDTSATVTINYYPIEVLVYSPICFFNYSSIIYLIIFMFISLIIFNYFFWFLFFFIFEYSNYGFIDIIVLKIYEKRKDTRERLGLVRAARNYRFELHRRWMIYDSGYGAAYDSIYRYRPRATLKLASLFASRILGELLIGNTRKWIRCIHRFTR